MKVARSLAIDRVTIADVPNLIAGRGEVVCRLLACGVCKSDVTDWYVASKIPTVLGHELVAEVTAVGEEVTTVAVGDRVVVHHHSSCGHCRRCWRGHETLCEQFRAHRIDPGGFAQMMTIPAELVPELLTLGDVDPVAATFVEPLACVLRSQERAGLKAGDTLLVVGAGANGLLAVAAARARGVESIWVREPQAQRLALALEWGAEIHVNEQVDVAIVCTSDPQAIVTATEHLAPGATLCLYALPAPEAHLAIDQTKLFLNELTITASYSASSSDMRAALALIASGEIDPLPLVSHRFDLQETQTALKLTGAGEALKAVIVG